MAMAEFRKEIAILKACRDVNIVQFVVSRGLLERECVFWGGRGGWSAAIGLR